VSTFTTGTSVMAMSCQRSSYELTASVHRGARTISPSFGLFGVASCITDAGSGRAVDVRISDARSNEEPIGFDPIALAIHMRADAMCPFRPGSAVRGGDVVRRGANPDVLSVVSCRQVPDAQVMALGKSVERFLEYQIGRPALHQQRGKQVARPRLTSRLDSTSPILWPSMKPGRTLRWVAISPPNGRIPAWHCRAISLTMAMSKDPSLVSSGGDLFSGD
jgi:hypothetical protein